MLAPFALLAANKKSPGTPAPTPAPAGTDTVNTKVVVTPNDNRGPVSLTPGPMLAPGSPIANRTTIVPFPVPGETSITARKLSKQLNRPREGVTALEPPSAGALGGVMVWRFPRGSYQMLPRPDTLRITGRSPLYPKAAKDAGIQGTVLMMAEIMPDGSVGGTKVVESTPALDDAAVQAVKPMRFRPAPDQGKAVSVWLGIPVRFTLH
jgi:protein TonB